MSMSLSDARVELKNGGPTLFLFMFWEQENNNCALGGQHTLPGGCLWQKQILSSKPRQLNSVMFRPWHSLEQKALLLPWISWPHNRREECHCLAQTDSPPTRHMTSCSFSVWDCLFSSTNGVKMTTLLVLYPRINFNQFEVQMVKEHLAVTNFCNSYSIIQALLNRAFLDCTWPWLDEMQCNTMIPVPIFDLLDEIRLEYMCIFSFESSALLDLIKSLWLMQRWGSRWNWLNWLIRSVSFLFLTTQQFALWQFNLVNVSVKMFPCLVMLQKGIEGLTSFSSQSLTTAAFDFVDLASTAICFPASCHQKNYSINWRQIEHNLQASELLDNYV